MAGAPKRKAKREAMSALQTKLEADGVSPEKASELARSMVNESMSGGDSKTARGEGSYENVGKGTVEQYDPKKAADFIFNTAEPWAVVKQAAMACGLPHNTAVNLTERLRTRYLPVKSAVKTINTGEILKQLDSKIMMALDHMDEFAFAGANLRDLGIVLGLLIEKRQLLSGEPTAILGVDDRRQLNELVGLVVGEAKHRGITIDANEDPDHPRALLSHDLPARLDSTYRRVSEKAAKAAEVNKRTK